MKVFSFVILTLTLFFSHGCTGVAPNPDSQVQSANSALIFSDTVTNFKVHVFYEAGADPYVGNIGITTDATWDITKSSYEALFQNHPGRTVTVPSTLAQMTPLPAQSRAAWSASLLLGLARTYAPDLVSDPTADVSVIFVNGNYEGSAEILGIQFTGYPYAFIFKDIVVSAGGNAVSQRYVEQATVVHELGHVVGLVHHGVPMVTNHEDGAHPHHSTDTACVMYWEVDTQSNVLSAIANMILGGQLNLFAAESLQDGRNFHGN